MDFGVAMRTNAGRVPERAVKHGNCGRTAVIARPLTFKQWSLSGQAHVRDGVDSVEKRLAIFGEQ